MKSTHVLAFVLVACVAVVLLTLVATVLYVKDANDQRRDDQIASCSRGNNVRSELNAVVAVIGLNLPVLPILDCRTIIH